MGESHGQGSAQGHEAKQQRQGGILKQRYYAVGELLLTHRGQANQETVQPD